MTVAAEPSFVPLLAVGDSAACDTTTDDKVAAFLRKRTAPVAILGDAVYERGTAAEYENCFDPIYGPMFDRLQPAPGNHDYATAGAQGYFDYFGARARRPGKGWYAFSLGEHWRVIALNSQCSIVGCDKGSAQYKWLQTALERAASRNVLAFFHVPRYSTGSHGSSLEVKPLFRALYRARADVVLSGHDHSYERFAPQNASGDYRRDGVQQFVVGTGGRRLYSWSRDPLPNTRARNNDTYGVLRLALRADGYSWRFIPVIGDYADSGSRTLQ